MVERKKDDDRKLYTCHVPTSDSILSSRRDLISTQAFYHVRRKLKRVSSFPPSRVLNTSKFTESPFLRRTLCFTRKLLPVSQQIRTVRNEREWLTTIFPPVPRFGIFLL